MKSTLFVLVACSVAVGCLWGPAAGVVAANTMLNPASTVIVKASDAADKAAALLQDYLRKVYQVDSGFEIVAEDAPQARQAQIVLALGPAGVDTRDMWRDGYVISRRGRVVTICGGAGGDARGTFHGAVAFLDQFAGVRFYMPGDLWTSMPQQRSVRIPSSINIRSTPFVTGSYWTGMNWGENVGGWAERNAVQTRAGLAGSHQHQMWSVFNPEKYAQKYPELYPVINGERYIPQSSSDQKWNPSLTSDQTYAAAKESAIEHFAKNPDYFWFSLGLQDSNAVSDTDVQAMDDLMQEFRDLAQNHPERLVTTWRPNSTGEEHAKRYGMAQLQWRMLNRLASEMEDVLGKDRFIQAMAYGVVAFPPQPPQAPLHRNVMLYSQIHVSDNMRGMLEHRREDGSYPIDDFITASRAYGNHDWYRGEGYLVPRIYCDYHAKFMRHVKKSKREFYFQHIEAYPNWGLDGPKYWVLAQLQWDPDRDVDALWRQFCEDLFGPAADHVFNYFATLRRWYVQQSVPEGFGGSPGGKKWGIKGWAGVFKRQPEDLTLLVEARSHLNRAIELAATEPQRQRLDLFSRSLGLTERLYDLGTVGATPEKIAETKTYFDQAIAPDEMTIGNQRRAEGFIDGVINAIAR